MSELSAARSSRWQPWCDAEKMDAEVERLREKGAPAASVFALARKGFVEGWQTGRYDGGSRRRGLLVGLLWMANRVAESKL